jgi:hypothetical protein
LKWESTLPGNVTLDALPDWPRVFDGPRDRRFLALAVETLVHDVSLDGDADVARQLGGYALGEEGPPAEAPEYVSLDRDRLELSNPPFVLGTIDVEGGDPAGEGEYRLEAGFDSELNLLIDPPVEVAFEGEFEAVLEALEDTLAQVYRTRGRYLEQVDAGVTDPGTAGE